MPVGYKRRSMRPLGVLLLSLFSVAAHAWTDTGHMVVSRIAELRLKPKAKAELLRLNKIGSDDYTNTLATWACYADDHKGDPDRKWHYKDLYFRPDGKPARNKPDDENLVTAMKRFVPILGDRRAPDTKRAEAARYILHLVGDAHQPLHALARETDAYPNGDRGGNDFRLADIRGWSDRPVRNLHLAWDLGLGEFLDLERPLTPADRKVLDGHVARVTKEFPYASQKGVNELDPDKWIVESAGYRDFVYSATENGLLTQTYIAQGRKIIRQRLAIAGYRLANLLNKLLG